VSISPELRSGAGFLFENNVAAMYLVSLLSETTSYGLEGHIVQRVLLQQAPLEPLDDLIIDFKCYSGEIGRLSLQIKQSLTISGSRTNEDFREIIINSWKTLQKDDFKQSIDRYGFITGTVAADTFKDLSTICEWARASDVASSFIEKFGKNGCASASRKKIKNEIYALLIKATESKQLGEENLHKFFKHFVCIRIDSLHEGANSTPEQINSLTNILHESDKISALDLWTTLKNISREDAGKKPTFDRKTLLNRLKGRFCFSAAPSLVHDINVLNQITDEAIQCISSNILEIEISRKTLLDKVKTYSKQHRFTQIRGLPGTGKSALLKSLAQNLRNKGSTLFLKHDMLSGCSWLAFAHSISLRNTDIKLLLTEIRATGTPYLLIDGIDQVGTDQRKIIITLINEILAAPEFDDWNIIVTLRDSGVELLETWLPRKLFDEGGVSIIEVPTFNDEEAQELSRNIPALRELLLGNERVRKITRRPFFTSILAKEISTAGNYNRFTLKSEIDLISKWWSRGGYSAEHNIPQRQQALMDLARQNIYNIKISKLNDSTKGLLESLISDGIIQNQNSGHTVKFAHDIFFEWAFFHYLIDSGDDWIEKIISVGQPPILGRAVELLSQQSLIDKTWEKYTNLLKSNDKLRPQWLCAWITGPLNMPNFSEHRTNFETVTDAEEHKLLCKLLNWFQTERTIPNPLILNKTLLSHSSKLSPQEIIRLADMGSWPSDIYMWRRLIEEWILDRLPQLPRKLIPKIIGIFEVWQNMFWNIQNPISEKVLKRSNEWLVEIEENYYSAQPNFYEAKEQTNLEKSLRILILRSTASYPCIVETYLNRIIQLGHLRSQAYSEIIIYSPILASRYPQLLAKIACAELMEELPEDQLKREEEEMEIYFASLLSNREKQEPDHPPEIEQQLSSLKCITSPFGRPLLFEWNSLGINQEHQDNDLSSSPLHEPFYSLFAYSPDIARNLTKDIANHAITAWKQLHNLNNKMPLPLVLDFPWGRQEFWGGNNEYMWGRGTSGPQSVTCAFLSLDAWAFQELEKGRDPDDIVKDILKEHTSVGALAIAVAILLSSKQVSETTLPIITNQKLWEFDFQRWVEDQFTLGRLYGFSSKKNGRHLEAVQKIDSRPCRKLELKSIVPLFIFSSNKEISQKAKKSIEEFPASLPFNYYEEADNLSEAQALEANAKIWAETGKIKNYVLAPHPKGNDYKRLEYQPIKPLEPIKQDNLLLNSGMILFNWVEETYRLSQLSEKMTLSKAIQQAKQLDHINIFLDQEASSTGLNFQCSSVAGVAALTIQFDNISNNEEKIWAVEVIERACLALEKIRNPQKIISYIVCHPYIFIARALSSKIKKNSTDLVSKERLFKLIGYPLEQVSLEALKQALDFWDAEPHFSWHAIDLCMRLCISSRTEDQNFIRGVDNESDNSLRSKAIEAVIRNYNEKKHFYSLTPLPDACVLALPKLNKFFHVFRNKNVSYAAWADPDTYWRWDYAYKVINLIPIRKIMNDSRYHDGLLELCDKMLNLTLERINPSWVNDQKRQQNNQRDDLLKGRRQLANILAFVTSNLSATEIKNRYLQKFFGLKDKLCVSFIESFIDRYIHINILNSENIKEEVIEVIDYCVDRVLQNTTFNRADRIYSIDFPYLIPTFLFIHSNENNARRFANGKWQDIGLIIPIVNKFISKAGWSTTVVTHYLTLCEKAIKHYPVEEFGKQVLSIIVDYSESLVYWKDTTIPKRISNLIQSFAEKGNRHFELPIARNLLRIIDVLADMGDRRSAVLQNSEVFRNVGLTGQ